MLWNLSHMRLLSLSWVEDGIDMSREYSQLPGHGLQVLHLGSSRGAPNRKTLVVQQVADGTYRVYFELAVPEDFYHHRSIAVAAESESESVRSLLIS